MSASLQPQVPFNRMNRFFNDLKVTDPGPVIPAAQYFGTRGFFHSYDARLHEPLTEAVEKVWQQGFNELQSGSLDSRKLAARVSKAASTNSPETGRTRGEEILRMWKQLRS